MSARCKPADRERRAARMVALYRRGLTLDKVGRECGVSYELVRLVLKRAGVARRPNGSAPSYSNAQLRTAIRVYRAGGRISEVVAVLGVASESGARHALRQAGVQPRPRRTAPCGTRASYVRGCRCERCNEANARNTSAYRERNMSMGLCARCSTVRVTGTYCARHRDQNNAYLRSYRAERRAA